MTPIVDYLAQEEKTKARKAGKKQRMAKLLKNLLKSDNPKAVTASFELLATDIFGGDWNAIADPTAEQHQATLKWFGDEMQRYSDELSLKRLRERLGPLNHLGEPK